MCKSVEYLSTILFEKHNCLDGEFAAAAFARPLVPR